MSFIPLRRKRFQNVSSSSSSAAQSAEPVEGLQVAYRFVQTLLKKLPGCVESNPIKMAASIAKTLIEIKDDIEDNNDELARSLRETLSILKVIQMPTSEIVSQPAEVYMRDIKKLKAQIIEISQTSKIVRFLDYEKYKTRIRDIFRRLNEATNMFKIAMQISITRMANQILDVTKRTGLEKLKPSIEADHNTVVKGLLLRREVCTVGTRIKILEDITNWASDTSSQSPPVFWMTGQAGSGKTTLAYTIAKKFETGQSTALGSNFLCSRHSHETRTLEHVIPTIAYQLARKSKSYADALHVVDKLDTVNHEVSQQMQGLLVQPWELYQVIRDPNAPPYLVVIDALDEIEDYGGSALLQNLLTTINNNRLQGLKFLVTSRPNPEIAKLCATFSVDAVCRLQDVPIEEAKADIRTYLEVKLPVLVDQPELTELIERASGLFVYAATAVKILTKNPRLTEGEKIALLRRFLQHESSDFASVSKDKSPIDQLYEQIMCNAFSEFTGELLTRRLQILYNILCAAERISTHIAGMLAGDDSSEITASVVEDLHAVLYIQNGYIFWYHSSFPDFIFTQTRSNFRVGNEQFDFWCNEPSHHNFLAASCFHIMESKTYGLRFNMGDITSSYLLDSEHTDELSVNISKNITPVLCYACLYWARHLSTPAVQDIGKMCTLISNFLKIRVLFWIEAMNLLGSSDQSTPMLLLARQWVLISKCAKDTELALARDLLETSNFATYFAGSPAAESTPHLYISSLATWKQESSLSQNWKSQISHIPLFTHANVGNDVPLLVIRIPQTRVFAVAPSNNGTWIASGSADTYVRIWDTSTGKEVKIFKGHINSVNSVVFSSDDKLVVSGSRDSTVRLWDVSTGQCLRVMEGHTGWVNSVSFSANGLRLVSGSMDKSICVWDILTGSIVTIINGQTDIVNSVAISSDGAWIASCLEDCSIRLWDASTGEELRAVQCHTKGVNSVAISHDNAWVAFGSRDCSVRLWDAATGRELRVMEGHTESVLSVAFSSNGDWIISGSGDNSVRVWNASTGQALKVFKGHTNWVYSVALSSDATRVISGSADGTVRVWNVSPSRALDVAKGTTVSVRSVAFSSDGIRILFGCIDGSVHVWDATTRRELHVLRECTEGVASVAFSNDGSHIAWGSGKKVWMWDLLRNHKVKVLEGHTDCVNSIAFSGHGSLVVSGSDDCTIRLWDALKGVELKRMGGHTRRVRSVEFSGDGKKIVSSSDDDQSIQIWDVVSGETLIGSHKHLVLSVAFSSDAARIVSGCTTVTVWDARTGAELKVLRGHTSWVHSVAFSSDAVHVVSGSDDSTVRVWNASTGEEIKALQGRHNDWVKSIAISRDGKLIVSGSWDGSVILWDMEDPAWYKSEDGWILSYPSNHRLMWAPPEARALRRPNCHVLVSEHLYSSIDFKNSMIGLAWSQCYTPTHPGH